MTEKEKRDAGELYSPEALQEELLRCKELCFDFNALRPSQEAEKAAIIQKLFRNGHGRPPFRPYGRVSLCVGMRVFARQLRKRSV